MKIYVSEDILDMYLAKGYSVLALKELNESSSGELLIVIDNNISCDVSLLKKAKYNFEQCLFLHSYELSATQRFNFSSINTRFVNDITVLSLHDIKAYAEDFVSDTNTCSDLKPDSLALADMLDKFLTAIDCKDKDSIEESFVKFDVFKDSPNEIRSLLKRLVEANKHVSNLELDTTKLKDSMDNLVSKYENMSKQGKELEGSNFKYVEQISDLNSQVASLKSTAEISENLIREASIKLKGYDKDCSELRTLTTELETRNSQFQRKIESLQKENHTLLDSLNKVQLKTQDSNISLVDMGTVSKVLYVKYIDMVPYVASMFRLYQKYCRGVLKTKLGICIVCPEDSIHEAIYLNTYAKVEKNTVFSKADTDTYVLSGYSPNIKEYVKNCGCDVIVVLDMTMSSLEFLECAYMNTVYALNNLVSVEYLSPNLSKCITQNHTLNCGMHIKYYEDYGKSSNAGVMSDMKLNLFPAIDSLWR